MPSCRFSCDAHGGTLCAATGRRCGESTCPDFPECGWTGGVCEEGAGCPCIECGAEGCAECSGPKCVNVTAERNGDDGL